MSAVNVALKVLIVVTSHSQLGNTGKLTGYYLPEVAHPYAALVEKGISVDFASPLGGAAPLDANSVKADDKVSREFFENPENRASLEHTLTLSQIDPRDYDAVLYAGGHGTMWDFRNNAAIDGLNRAIYEQGGFVAAVCHGPAAILTTILSDGRNLIAGKNVAGFSDAEESAAGLTSVVPFLLEAELRKAGAKYSKADLWQAHVVVDGRLITGQNPASAESVGKALAKALTK